MKSIFTEYNSLRASVITWSQCTEAFLTGGVPYGQLHSVSVHGQRLYFEVDADCRRLAWIELVVGESQ